MSRGKPELRALEVARKEGTADNCADNSVEIERGRAL